MLFKFKKKKCFCCFKKNLLKLIFDKIQIFLPLFHLYKKKFTFIILPISQKMIYYKNIEIIKMLFKFTMNIMKN